MFEKAKPFHTPRAAPSRGHPAEANAGLRAASAAAGEAARFAGQPARRAGDALRALEWSELTARLNAARDLRLLLRTESQGAIEAVAASFGDAAASYFALLDDGEPNVNPDALGRLNLPGAKVASSEANRPGDAAGPRSDAPRGAARDK